MPSIAASSIKPVKRYNILIKELFENKEPIKLQGYLNPAVEKKVDKLYEYVEFLPYRAPKVYKWCVRDKSRVGNLCVLRHKLVMRGAHTSMMLYVWHATHTSEEAQQPQQPTPPQQTTPSPGISATGT